jgi:hypothetical protein
VKVANLKDKNKKLVDINQEQSKRIDHELSEKTVILDAGRYEFLEAEKLREQLSEERVS